LAPPAITNGNCVDDGGTTVGHVATCTCNSPFQLAGNATLTCTGSGWGTPPTCTCDSYVYKYDMTGRIYVRNLLGILEANIGLGATSAFGTTMGNGFIRIRVPGTAAGEPNFANGARVDMLEMFLPQEFIQTIAAVNVTINTDLDGRTINNSNMP